MKISIFKSVRMKMALYTLFSVIAMLATDLVILTCVFGYTKIISINEVNFNNQIAITNEIENSSNKRSNKIREDYTNEYKKYINKNPFVAIFIIVMFSVLIFMIYFMLISHNFICYLREIIAGIEKIKKGDFDTNVPVKGDDEISIMAVSLNDMRLEIREIMEKERMTEKTKNDLITNMAHDLRTPLTSIIGYLELIKDTDLPKDVEQKYIDIVYNKSKRLSKLIEELFDYTRYEKNKVKLHTSVFDVSRFMEQLTDEFYPNFCENSLNCQTSFCKDELLVKADGELLARAISNLINNAIKYGADGKIIKITTHRMQNKARIGIINYGRIIPKEDLDKIFDKFYRVEGSRSVNTGGTGLGLAIARNIILMHDGEINVESDEENGTVFEIILNLYKKESGDKN